MASSEKLKELNHLRDTEFSSITEMLKKSAHDYGNDDALSLLAELNFFSKYSYPRNYHDAFGYYHELASKGNATAQQMIGFMYSTGIGKVVPRDQAMALLYHTFAAHGGDTAAEMTLGYRYLMGIGTDEKCEDALYHYKRVATKVIDYYLSGPPGGHTPPLSKVRLSEKEGGIYGYGASLTTDKRTRHGTGGHEKTVSMEEILQYWRYLAAKQDVDAQLMLGQVYYLGTRSIPRNFEEALVFFGQIVDKIPANGKIPSKNGKAIGQAAGYLGLMHWRGEGVAVNPKVAHGWFEIGKRLGDSTSQNALGMMYLDGIVVPKNREKAIELFKKAADQENPHAQVNLAIEYAQKESSMPLAVRLFTKAADSKHLLAYWYLAHMNEQSIIPRPSCRVAVSYFKAIAERGDWLNPTVEIAYQAYKDDDRENALLNYLLAAERGYEVAQSNVAYMLDKDKRMLTSIPWISHDSIQEEEPKAPSALGGLDPQESAFIYWTRSANQNNVDARVKMGDYYYKGIGTAVDYEKAVSCYRLAAETQGSPLAFWNLGWMYENGVGVTKDFHLAKRAYDHALSIEQDAYLPVKLSLLKMYAKYYWEWMMGREVAALDSQENNDGISKPRHNVRNKEVEAGDRPYDIGEEMERQYKVKKQKEREEQERLGEEDSFGSDPYGLDDFSEEDELFESLLILSICLLVGYLVYVRQFRFNGGGNNNQEQ
ncbi:hypothetical protein BD560DRAFT_333495 [Blakeslea trispora]|nr:hypothetical protein BD560DRAFT_333495 [Blakeslea trispora]